MSCDVTKLNYLNETKQLFRAKLDPFGDKITDETPFREYVSLVGAGNPRGLALGYSDSKILKVISGTATEIEED